MAGRKPNPPSRRPSLSRAVILEAAMRLSDDERTIGLTLSRLARDLGADATAVYRHFRNKDELILAMGDVLLAEAVAAFEPASGWQDMLRNVAWAMRRTFLARPALALQVFARFTGGEAEAVNVEHTVGALTAAGLDFDAAAGQSRAFTEMVLGHIGVTATLLTLSQEQQELDVTLGMQVYARPGTAPSRAELRSRVATAAENEDEIFRLMLETYLAGVAAQVSAARSATPRARARSAPAAS